MSDGRRFIWGCRNYSNTREDGDIPGILKACDVHVVISVEDMQRETAKRADLFCKLLEGSFKDFINHPMHNTDVALSAIQNPSKPYGKDW